MTIDTLKIIFALCIFVMIIISGWYPFKQRREKATHVDFALGETIATGVFLGAALLHMLPESQSMFEQHHFVYPFAYLITGVVFLMFLWFEHLAKEMYHHHDKTHPAFALVAWVMLSIHSLVVASALGLSQEAPFVMMLFFAIIIHKWAESFAMAIQLNRSQLKTTQNWFLFILFALMSPLGIFIGWRVGHTVSTQSLLDPILMATSAGTFLYLGTLHGLERCVLVEHCCNLRYFSFVIIGFLLMAAVAVYI